jgi:hypothetical protein
MRIRFALIALLLSSAAAHAQAVPAAGASVVAVSATGTTGVVTATMPALASQTNWICGFAIRSLATAAIAGTATVTGTVNTLSFVQPVGTTPAVGVTEERFDPCLPASSFNTAIAVNSIAASTGGVTSVTVWGYSKP